MHKTLDNSPTHLSGISCVVHDSSGPWRAPDWSRPLNGIVFVFTFLSTAQSTEWHGTGSNNLGQPDVTETIVLQRSTGGEQLALAETALP